METGMVPSYVNIFMTRFEQKHIYPFIKDSKSIKVDLYLGYIDDIFFIWKGIVIDLINLFNETIKKHPSIKFDQKYSKLEIEFLNVLVHKDKQQRLQATLLKKKTDRKSCLHPESDHPASLKKKYSVQSNTVCQKNLFNKQ